MPPSTFPKAVLFDHDGTMVDTEPTWGRAKARFARENGGTWTEQDTLDTIGLPIQATIERLRANGVTGPDDTALMNGLMKVSEEEIRATPPELIPGIPELLQEIADAGLPSGIVTNAAREMAEYTATLAPDEMFDVIIGNEEAVGGVAPKPSPEGYLEAARRLRVDPSECVALEDSPSGVAAAQAAGMVVVVLPGALDVPQDQGTVHVADHRQVTLSLLQWLDPQRSAWPKAVLFDHDGTTVNSEPEWAAAKRAVAAEHGQSWTVDDDQASLGQTVQFSAEMMVQRGAVGDVQHITDRIGARVVEALKNNIPLFPGMPELLEELRHERIPAALVTNALAPVVATTAAALPENIRAVVSREDVEHPKPAGEPYQVAAERLMCAPEDCVAVEDSPAGAQAAVAAGMPVVVVPGEKPVQWQPGFVPVNSHTDVTLERIRQIGPLIPDLPQADAAPTHKLPQGTVLRPAGEILTVNWA